MTKTDAVKTRIENVESELRSMSTCTAATVTELQSLLCGDPPQSEKENRRVVRARTPNARVAARSRPGTAASTRTTDDVANWTTPRQRYVLATQVANTALKSLSDALKSPAAPRSSQLAAQSKHTTNPHNPQKASQAPSKTPPLSHPALKERPLGQVTNSVANSRSSRRSSSCSSSAASDPGLVATAECARVAFAYLSTAEATKSAGSDATDLTLENGRLALVGKLVTHGLDNLAVKEMRLLKKRLERSIRRNEKTEDSRSTSDQITPQPASATEKESLASLLDYGDVDYSSVAIPIIANLQIYVLRIIARSKRPRLVEEAWNYLKISHPSNPADLISHLAKEKQYRTKASRQLESLAQAVLQLCPSISSIADAEQAQPSPDIVLCLQHLAFGVRQRWWTLAQHKGDESKELFEPFSKCLVAFARRSTLPPLRKYKLAESLFSNLRGAANNTDFTRREDNVTSVVKNPTLASLARAADLPDEALRWLGATSSSVVDEPPIAMTIRSIRIAAVRLDTCLKKKHLSDEDTAVETALEKLAGNVNGTMKDLEILFMEVHSLRRVATRILLLTSSTADTISSSPISQQCIRVVEASVRFTKRFVGSHAPDKPSSKHSAALHDPLAMAAKMMRSLIESVTACCRLPSAVSETWAKLDALLQDCVSLVSQIERDCVTGEDPHSASYNGPQSPFVKLSHLYWTIRRPLQKLKSGPLFYLEAMQRSTALLESRTEIEQDAGQLGYKLEQLGETLADLGHFQLSRAAWKQSITVTLNDDLIVRITEASSNIHLSQIFERSSSSLARLLRSYVCSFATNGLSQADELAFFDDCRCVASVRGALLEYQLATYHQTLSKKRTWDPALGASIQALVERLSEIYEYTRFPIRRQRLHLLLLQLSQKHPELISNTYIQEHFHLESSVDINETDDRNFSRFSDHTKAMLTLTTLLQQIDQTTQGMQACLAVWQSIISSAKTWVDLANRIDDVDYWLETVQAAVDLLSAKGEVYQALPMMHLSVQALELQHCSDPSRLVVALCATGLLFLRVGYFGKAGSAFAKAEHLLPNAMTSVEARLRWHIGYAEYLLKVGNTEKCQSILLAAGSLAQSDTQFMELSQPHSPFLGRIIFQRIVADACYVSSLLSSTCGNHKNAARYARQAVIVNRRIWAALEARVNARKVTSTSGSNLLSEKSPSASSDPLHPTRTNDSAPLTSSITHGALKGSDFWSLIPCLYQALVHHSAVIAGQGMFEEAVHVLQQAEKVAQAIGSPTLLVDNTSRLAELWIQSGRPDKAQPLLSGLTISSTQKHINLVPYHLSMARMYNASQKFEEEMVEYDTLERLLHDLSLPAYVTALEGPLSALDGLSDKITALTLNEPRSERLRQPQRGRTRTAAVKVGPKTVARTTSRSSRSVPSNPASAALKIRNTVGGPSNTGNLSATDNCTVLESFLTEVAHRRVALYLLQGDEAQALSALNTVETTRRSQDGFHALVHFKTMLVHAIKSIANDFALNTLPESTIAFPSIPPSDLPSSEGATKRPVIKSLSKNARVKRQGGEDFAQAVHAEREKLAEAHSRFANAASNHIFRQLSAALSQATVLLSAVSQGRIRGSIHPLYSAYMSELPKHHALALDQALVEVDQESMSREQYLQWPNATIEELPLLSAAEFQTEYIDIIPKNWAAISVALSEEQDEIYITRYEQGVTPFVLRLPLARHSSRDLDEEEFTFADGKREFEEIIELSDFTTRNGKDRMSPQSKTQWWEDRQALDTKLRELLLNIENIWLGGFKGIFSNHVRQPALLSRFRKSFDSILSRHLPSRQKKNSQMKASLDSRVLELFIGLGNATNTELELDEALTDLVYFVVDILQFNGEPNAYDEIDFEAVVIETHDALRTYHDSAQVLPSNSHTILILDKNVHMLPWESLPYLEKLSVSRLPSLAALRDRLLAARAPTGIRDPCAGHYISAAAGGTSILNPSGDLGHTSKTIKPCLDAMQGSWKHITNRAPSEQEFEESLRQDQLLLYFGHGSGAQYIRSRVVRRLYIQPGDQAETRETNSGCATTFLFGCSSVHLSENGIYEPSGMLSSYLTAGAPAVLGMLWDVTDRDCDRLAVKTGELWGLWPEAEVEGESDIKPPPTARKNRGKTRVARLAEEVETPRASSRARKGEEAGTNEAAGKNIGKRRRGLGLDEALREARNVCLLRYLNGAAAVVYGIPVYLE